MRSFGTLFDTIRPLADPARILAETCRLLGTHLRVNRATYGEIEGDFCTIVDDYVDGLPSLAGRFQWTDLGGSRTDRHPQRRHVVRQRHVDGAAYGGRARGAAGGGHRRLHLSAAREGRPVRRGVRDSQPRAARLDSGRDRAGAGRRRPDLGDASSNARPKPSCARTKSGWRFSSGSTTRSGR